MHVDSSLPVTWIMLLFRMWSLSVVWREIHAMHHDNWKSLLSADVGLVINTSGLTSWAGHILISAVISWQEWWGSYTSPSRQDDAPSVATLRLGDEVSIENVSLFLIWTLPYMMIWWLAVLRSVLLSFMDMQPVRTWDRGRSSGEIICYLRCAAFSYGCCCSESCWLSVVSELVSLVLKGFLACLESLSFATQGGVTTRSQRSQL